MPLVGKANRNRNRDKQRTPLSVVGESAQHENNEMAGLLDQLAGAGVPDEVLRSLQNADSPAALLDMLGEGGPLPSPEDALDGILAQFAPLLDDGTDPLTAELAGADFLGMMRAQAPDETSLSEMLPDLLEQAENTGSAEAIAFLRTLAAVGPEQTRRHATEAADRLAAAGHADPAWVSKVGTPKIGPCFGYGDVFGAQESIAVCFRYGRKEHAVVVLIDHDLGGGVKDCFVTDQRGYLRDQYARITEQQGIELEDYTAEHAALILGRALGKPPCPEQPDQIEDVNAYLALLRNRVALLEGGTPSNRTSAGHGDTQQEEVGATDVHKIKVTLRGSKPPIWRRLEVSSTVTLEALHQIIQEAFGWFDCHMWAFETARGAYGVPDPELGIDDASAQRLDEVAPRSGDRFRYTYDFGDGWEHDVSVEGVADAEPGKTYPRCLTGRRACPPEDCGGIWGYQELVEILADPAHKQHEEMLDWLGLDVADEFDPAQFSKDEVNQRLATLAEVLAKP